MIELAQWRAAIGIFSQAKYVYTSRHAIVYDQDDVSNGWSIKNLRSDSLCYAVYLYTILLFSNVNFVHFTYFKH